METIRRTKIVDLLKREDFGAMVNVKGWVRTRRGSKQVNFIALNDGSTINNVQIVVDLANFDEELLKQFYRDRCARGAAHTYNQPSIRHDHTSGKSSGTQWAGSTSRKRARWNRSF